MLENNRFIPFGGNYICCNYIRIKNININIIRPTVGFFSFTLYQDEKIIYRLYKYF